MLAVLSSAMACRSASIKLAFITLLSRWREMRTVSRMLTLTSAVLDLGWLSTCFTWYSGERVKVKVMLSKTSSLFQTRSAKNSVELKS